MIVAMRTATDAKVVARFWAKVDKSAEGGCWLWTAAITKNGYGVFSVDGGKEYAHRFAYLLEHDEIPDGTELDHLCRVRHCVNPDHLEAVTHRINMSRGKPGGRPVYPDEKRVEAMTLAMEHGKAQASRLTGIPAGTIGSWMSRAGLATVAATESTKAATEARKASAEDRRARLAERLFELAEMSTDRAGELIEGASLRDLVGAWDYAIKNAQLLSGAATGRTEHTAGKEAAAHTLDELEKRRRAKAA